MGYHLMMARQFDRAIEFYEKALEIDPTYFFAHTNLGDAYVQQGRLEEAAASYRAASGLSEDPTSHVPLSQAYIEAVSGNGGEAEEILDRLESEGASVSPAILAMVYGALGDTDRAFDRLEQAYQQNDLMLTFINSHPWFDPLRDDPRFQDIVRRMNFPES